MAALIVFLFASYWTLHLHPKLVHSDADVVKQGQIRAALFFTPLIIMLWCYYLAFVTDPGTIPDTITWAVGHDNAGEALAAFLVEKKKDGELRNCKW